MHETSHRRESGQAPGLGCSVEIDSPCSPVASLFEQEFAEHTEEGLVRALIFASPNLGRLLDNSFLIAEELDRRPMGAENFGGR